jgi:hypothetical protein
MMPVDRTKTNAASATATAATDPSQDGQIAHSFEVGGFTKQCATGSIDSGLFALAWVGGVTLDEPEDNPHEDGDDYHQDSRCTSP